MVIDVLVFGLKYIVFVASNI